MIVSIFSKNYLGFKLIFQNIRTTHVYVLDVQKIRNFENSQLNPSFRFFRQKCYFEKQKKCSVLVYQVTIVTCFRFYVLEDLPTKTFQKKSVTRKSI